MNRQVHDALRDTVQLSLTLHAWLPLCLPMISLLHNIPFNFYQMRLKLCSNAHSQGNPLRPCLSFWCLSLFSLFAWGGTSHTGRPGWIPTQLPWGPKQTLSTLVDIPWVPDSHLTRLQEFNPPPLFLSCLRSLTSFWPHHPIWNWTLASPATITHQVFPNIHHVPSKMIFHLFD